MGLTALGTARTNCVNSTEKLKHTQTCMYHTQIETVHKHSSAIQTKMILPLISCLSCLLLFLCFIQPSFYLNPHTQTYTQAHIHKQKPLASNKYLGDSISRERQKTAATGAETYLQTSPKRER